jgi:alpha-beta hydrolase superfamily lysophospholipase
MRILLVLLIAAIAAYFTVPTRAQHEAEARAAIQNYHPSAEAQHFSLDDVVGYAKGMFAGARRMADPGQVSAVRADLPLYIAAGESDPVNANVALLNVLIDRYRAAGLTDVAGARDSGCTLQTGVHTCSRIAFRSRLSSAICHT